MSPPTVPEREIDEYIGNMIDLRKQGKTTYEIAHLLGLSQSTVVRRLKGHTNRHIAHEQHQKLSKYQEDELVTWILAEECCGRAPTKALVREFAMCILKAGGDEQPIGKHWADYFISRHENIRTKIGRPVSSDRINGTSNKEQLQAFYTYLTRLRQEYKVKSKNIANMDETGLQVGDSGGNNVVLGHSRTSRARVRKSDSSDWCTMLECITTERSITCGVVFQGMTVQAQNYPPDLPEWEYTSTASGWSNTRTMIDWFQTIYELETYPGPDEWRILILDGHKTHVAKDLMFIAWRSKVLLCYLPAHSSDKTQPLDVGIFSPLKEYYRQEMAKHRGVSTTAAISKHHFSQAYWVAREKAFSPSNVRSAFKDTGIYPFNPKVLLDDPLLFPPKPQPDRALTPPDVTWSAPRKGQSLREAVTRLEEDSGPLSRDCRVLFTKAAKGLDLGNVLPATQHHQIERLEAEAEKHKKPLRQKVPYQPNQVFVNAQQIRTAEEKRQLRMPDEELSNQLTIDDYAVNKSLKKRKAPPADKKAKKTK